VQQEVSKRGPKDWQKLLGAASLTLPKAFALVE